MSHRLQYKKNSMTKTLHLRSPQPDRRQSRGGFDDESEQKVPDKAGSFNTSEAEKYLNYNLMPTKSTLEKMGK